MGSSTEEEDWGGGDGTSEEEDAGVGGGGDDNGGEEDVGHDLDGGGVGDGGGGGSDTWELGSVFDKASSSEYDSDASTTTDDISVACLSGGPNDGRTVEIVAVGGPQLEGAWALSSGQHTPWGRPKISRSGPARE